MTFSYIVYIKDGHANEISLRSRTVPTHKFNFSHDHEIHLLKNHARSTKFLLDNFRSDLHYSTSHSSFPVQSQYDIISLWSHSIV